MAEHEHGCGYEHEHPHGADGDAGCHCSGSGSELVRFSVTAPDDLLRRFDEQIARRGDVANRSEAVRDLIRASIAKEQMRTPDEHVIGSLTMIYDHHTGDLTRRLDEVQHDYTDEIVSTMHVHLDHHNCLEILALKGRGERVYELADRLLGLRGVKHGEAHVRRHQAEPGAVAGFPAAHLPNRDRFVLAGLEVLPTKINLSLFGRF